ncbi:RNA polymerase recycling motor ATPase HelR [Brevibacterium album]|uniref:RNA polymerase recycling motor ATPase HelR n=1 Tax=Brevibacterium album TaxID=417948 RepID=UPI0003FD4E1C|nr:RNA polymerase recycling motor ATPase HelR [Brevibacterium album]
MDTPSFFALPPHLEWKTAPEFTARDQDQLSAVAEALRAGEAQVRARLRGLRRSPGGYGEAALERDLAIHRLSARLRLLRRFDVEICLGRMVPEDGSGPVYIGRMGLLGSEGEQLLLDWRAPAAAPFFSATLAHPQGLRSRRRYRWSGGRIADFWDEALYEASEARAPELGPAGSVPPGQQRSEPLALDEQSAFLTGLGAARTGQMRDVLATIQADQDAIIRADAAGQLVVDGGPGTGKTVVALHRAAHLLHSRPRLRRGGGVLVIGPHRPYLDYVADVLPALGEEGVRMCTLADLVPEGESASGEDAPEARRLKESADPVAALEAAVAIYEEPPAEALWAETPWADLLVDRAVWQEAFDAREPGTSHNAARDQVWEALVEILHDRAVDAGGEVPSLSRFRSALAQDEELRTAFSRAWPLLRPQEIVGDLWTVPDYARLCLPGLSEEQARLLVRERAQAWTAADLPFLDAAHRRIGDPDAQRHARRRAAARAAEAEERERVAADLISADDGDLQIMSMLRGADLRDALTDPDAGEGDGADARAQAAGAPEAERSLDGPFAHIIVDEAQELTDAQWRMVLSRCPSHSLTLVGDRAQARRGFAGTWAERLGALGMDRVTVAELSVNYRTPAEVMEAAAPVIRAVMPEANVPRSVRRSGEPVVRTDHAGLRRLLDAWLRTEAEGTACVIAPEEAAAKVLMPGGVPAPEAAEQGGAPAAEAARRIRVLTPETAKGMEFDVVALVEPESWAPGSAAYAAAVDRYVAMTRSTRRLVLVT